MVNDHQLPLNKINNGYIHYEDHCIIQNAVASRLIQGVYDADLNVDIGEHVYKPIKVRDLSRSQTIIRSTYFQHHIKELISRRNKSKIKEVNIYATYITVRHGIVLQRKKRNCLFFQHTVYTMAFGQIP